MTTREANRLRAKAHREACARSDALKQTATRAAVDRALKQFWDVAADPDFVAILQGKRHTSVPIRSAAPVDQRHGFGHHSLEFVVAWTFLYPLLADEEIAAYLNRDWPNFIIEMKDAFILLVSNGPFPLECRTVGRPMRSPFPSERRQKSSATSSRRDS